jgi:alcohol dehydrogenase
VAELDAARAEAVAARAEGVLGLGGGSALDLAKLTAMLLVNGGAVASYFGVGRVPRRGLPTLMLPTTAGSGSEVSQDAVLTDRAAGTKRAVKDPHLVPDCAVIDPDATLSCPPALTAASGLDALCHAIEAFTGRRSHPLTDLYALEAARLLAGSLPRVVERGDDVSARETMARGALLAGHAFSSVGTGAVHACGYPLSAICGLPHGIANAVMLPAVSAFNAETSDRYERLAAALSTASLPDALRDLVAACGVATRLRDHGVARETLPRLAAIAAQDERHLSANPRPMSEPDLATVFERSW